jgi:hypothetical protein
MKKYHSTWPANKTWLIKGSKVHNALKEVVLDKRNIMRFNNVRLKDQYDEGYSRNALIIEVNHSSNHSLSTLQLVAHHHK